MVGYLNLTVSKSLVRFLALFFVALLGVFLFFSAPLADDANEQSKGGPPRLVIKNNKLSDSGFGIYIGPRDEEVLIKGNTITGNAEAIRLTGVKAENLVTDNRIVDNLAGITLRDRYSDNKEGYVKYPVDPEDINIRSNEFRNNEAGNIINFLEENSQEENSTEKAATSGSEKGGNSGSETTETEATDSGTSASETEGVSEKEGEVGQESRASATTSSKKGTTNSNEEKETTKEKEENSVKDKQESSGKSAEGAEKKVSKTENSKSNSTKSRSKPEEKESIKESSEKPVGDNHTGTSSEVNASGDEDLNVGPGNPYIIAGATVVGLTTLLLVFKSSM